MSKVKQYYLLLLFSIFIIFNILFKDLMIEGLLYDIIMIVWITLNFYFILKENKILKCKEGYYLLSLLSLLFCKNIYFLILVVTTLLLITILNIKNNSTIKTISIIFWGLVIINFRLILFVGFLLLTSQNKVIDNSHYYCDDFEIYIHSANAIDSFHYVIVKRHPLIKIEDILNIEYIETNKKGKYNLPFKVSIFCYIISILIFLTYLRLEYNPTINLNYFLRLLMTIFSSFLILIGNFIYSNNYVDKLSDKKKINKLSNLIIFIYYATLLFNMAIFSRVSSINSYNLIPFRSIYEIISKKDIYAIIINIAGNFLIFMPIEYFMIELFNIKKFSKNLLLSFLIILIGETVQYIFKIGVFDIDDIILCLSGMMIFYFCYIKFREKSKR